MFGVRSGFENLRVAKAGNSRDGISQRLHSDVVRTGATRNATGNSSKGLKVLRGKETTRQ